MKKCVTSSQDKCEVKVARCVDFCYDSADQEKCNCENPDYPRNWVGKTCATAAEPLPERPNISGLKYMRMAGIEEVNAFVEQNLIRTNPRGIQREI